ncbi:MAG: hypothetical protein J1F11_01840 [Oscillospiraceae bacterium]|nr:hypothetical protein [Oscillospiraceae bacterium]
MSVVFDLTVTGPEILDAVMFMEKSPACAAFKEEIEKILADFNKNARFGQGVEIDVKSLVESSQNEIKNMQRSFLIWTFHEDIVNKAKEPKYNSFLKLFFKGQEKQLTALNGGSKSIAPADAPGLRDKFIEEIGKNSDLFNSLKEFFSGYVYGYFFNYLTEQTVMKDYAEFLVCMGIMSGKITVGGAAQQKILLKMSELLNNDRFKYIYGELPIDVMMEQVYDRFSFTSLEKDEEDAIKDILKKQITENYPFNETDGLVADDVMTNAMSKFNKNYISAAEFAEDLHKNTFDGVRTFLDGDKNDIGDFPLDRLVRIVAEKCSQNNDEYYRSGREPVLEFGLSADMKGYKYPLTYKDGDTYWFNDSFKVALAPACDKSIYISIKEDDLPLRMFPFAGPALETNIIRVLGGIKSEGYSIRADKRSMLVEMNALPASKNLSEEDKKMMALEKLLYIISGSMDAVSYNKLVDENVFGTKLYEDYIRYRMDNILSKGMSTLEAKKNLLGELNKLK